MSADACLDETVLSAETYTRLRSLAAAQLSRERPDHTQQPTSLVHEAYIRLCRGGSLPCQSELVRHAARVMRQVLVDHARRRDASKRSGNGHRVVLSDDLAADSTAPVNDLIMDEALLKLEQLDPDLAGIVELRYFGGLSAVETASHLGVSLSTVSRRWRIAKMFLARELDVNAS